MRQLVTDHRVYRVLRRLIDVKRVRVARKNRAIELVGRMFRSENDHPLSRGVEEPSCRNGVRQGNFDDLPFISGDTLPALDVLGESLRSFGDTAFASPGQSGLCATIHRHTLIGLSRFNHGEKPIVGAPHTGHFLLCRVWVRLVAGRSEDFFRNHVGQVVIGSVLVCELGDDV